MLDFMNIRPVGAELFHADVETEVTKPTVICRDITNASNTRWFKFDRDKL